jgi:hypothetical protein
MRYNGDRIKESAECLNYIKCQQSETANVSVADYHRPTGMNHHKSYRYESLTFLLHWK